jgi:hypothetical protein
VEDTFKKEEENTKILYMFAVLVVGLTFITKRRVLMKSGRGFLVITVFLMAAVMVFPCSLRKTEAGPRGERAVEGPRGGAVEGPRGNVAVGTRYNVLPDSAKATIVGDRTYYVDGSGVYYLPCDDDTTVFCVVPAPQ